MRGLQPPSNPNTIYLVVKYGTLCQESKIMRDGYDPIELADRDHPGVTYFKYIKPWAGVEAMVTDIKFRDEVFNGIPYVSWRIHMRTDGPSPIVLDLPLNSNVGDRFMRCAENIDFSRPVEFRAWQERESKKTAFMIGQRDNETDEKAKNVPQLYTKDNPGDCPPARQRFDKTWDFEAQKEFLYQRMIEVVIPRVHAANGTKPESEPEHEDHDPFESSATGATSAGLAQPSAPVVYPQSAPAPSPSSVAPDDPFARRPATPGAATGSAGPITQETLAKLQTIANLRPELPPFNEIANRLFQKNVVDLSEGAGIAMIKYVGDL